MSPINETKLMKTNLYLLTFKVKIKHLNKYYNNRIFKEILLKIIKIFHKIILQILIKIITYKIKFPTIKKEIFQINQIKKVLLYKYMSKMKTK